MDIARFSTIPQRRFLPAEAASREDFLDEHGFLSARGRQLTMGIADLFEFRAVLVVAPPWFGKSHVAKQLRDHLLGNTESRSSENPFGQFCHAVMFQRFGIVAAVEPTWWAEWKADGQRACWIVDAIDDDARREDKRVHEILDLVEQLAEAERKRLLLLMFCRENEQPPEVLERLGELYAIERDRDSLLTVRLAPPDSEEAARIAGSHAKFARVCQLIKANQLEPIGGFPCVIQELAGQDGNASLSLADVWRRVLTGMLTDKRAEREAVLNLPAVPDRFQATARIAAALTLSGQEEVDDGLACSTSPTIPELFSDDLPRVDHLRAAARFSLDTAVFQRTATGYRIAEHHVQEWFTAFALEKAGANKLRPLFEHAGTPFKRLQGVLGILREITTSEEVRNWIIDMYDGVPPPSEAAPWTLNQAIPVLERLQELARKTTWRLRIWREKGLENLRAPGIGAEVARRLGTPGLSDSEKDLLIEVADVLHVSEASAVAEQILRDPSERDGLRTSAAYLVAKVSSDRQLEGLGRFVETAESDSREERALLSVLIRALLRRGLWSHEQALNHAPRSDTGLGDATFALQHELLEKMTLDDARGLLGRTDWNRVTPTDVDYVRRCLKLVSGQTLIPPADRELLHRAVFACGDEHALIGQIEEIIAVLARDPETRRALFAAGLERDPRGEEPWWSWQLRYVLTFEDAEWLLDLAQDLSTVSPWLWDHALALACAEGVTQVTKNRIRRFVRAHDNTIVDAFDKSKRKHADAHRRREQRHARRTDEQVEQWELAVLVKRTLDWEDRSPENRLHQLSWCCFACDSFRPTNVIGQWDDLPTELQSEVLAVCARDLTAIQPTPIPDDGPFSVNIIHEEDAFNELVQHPEAYQMTADEIRKWLPATFVTSHPDNSRTLARCWEVDRPATEDVILKAIQRESRGGNSEPYAAVNLPSEYWSQRVVRGILEVVMDDGLRLEKRSKLLKVLAIHDPPQVIQVAKSWAEQSADEESNGRLQRTTGLDVLLAIDPGFALPELRREVQRSGRQILSQLDALSSSPWGPKADLRNWPAACLEQLGALLQDEFPPKNDPETKLGVVLTRTCEDDLRTLRRNIPAVLFERGQPDDEKALSRLAERYADVKRWRDWAKAERDASTLLQGPATIDPATRATEGAVPLYKVVRLLDRAEYRLIRSAEDLQRVILEVLEEIRKTVRQHLPMLYRPPPPRSKNTGSGGRSQPGQRERLYEDALQAYLHCRLQDFLRGRALDEGTQIIINREVLANTNRRTDLKVEAPTIGGQLATVIIEVKWSDNTELSTSLTEQLGKNYLQGDDLTHGIYFVGWYRPGSWCIGALGTEPEHKDSLDCWLGVLRLQAIEFSKQHPDVHIEPIMLDLRWALP